MHILYNLETLDLQCIMYDCHELLAAHNRTLPNHVEHPERLPAHEVHLEPHPTEPGKVVVSRKQPIEARLAASSVQIGKSILIDNVPQGVEIHVNGELLGAMDDSGQLELTADTGGYYDIRLSKRAYVTQELRVEAHG